jgi:hypothetical protein
LRIVKKLPIQTFLLFSSLIPTPFSQRKLVGDEGEYMGRGKKPHPEDFFGVR